MTAKATARRILEMYWNFKIPVDIDEIAHRMGVEVRYRRQLEGGADISGRFDFINGKPVCTIRNTDSLQRQRFTLAHELGHFALEHGSGFRDNMASFNLENYDQREVDANAFAAEILMPKDAVDQLIEEGSSSTVSSLASDFDVSQPAMRYRLKNLGWL